MTLGLPSRAEDLRTEEGREDNNCLEREREMCEKSCLIGIVLSCVKEYG